MSTHSINRAGKGAQEPLVLSIAPENVETGYAFRSSGGDPVYLQDGGGIAVPEAHRHRVPVAHNAQGYMSIMPTVLGQDIPLIHMHAEHEIIPEVQEQLTQVPKENPEEVIAAARAAALTARPLPQGLGEKDILATRFTYAGGPCNADVTGVPYEATGGDAYRPSSDGSNTVLISPRGQPTPVEAPVREVEYMTNQSFAELAKKFRDVDGNYQVLTAYGSVSLPEEVMKSIPEKFVAEPIVQERELFVYKQQVVERTSNKTFVQFDHEFRNVRAMVEADRFNVQEEVKVIEVPRFVYKPIIEDKIIEVPQGIKYVEVPIEVPMAYPPKIVPVPKPHVVERVVETTKPVNQYKIIDMPKIVRKKVPKIVTTEIPYVVPKYVERIIEVPYRADMSHLPQPKGSPMMYIPQPPPLPSPGKESSDGTVSTPTPHLEAIQQWPPAPFLGPGSPHPRRGYATILGADGQPMEMAADGTYSHSIGRSPGAESASAGGGLAVHGVHGFPPGGAMYHGAGQGGVPGYPSSGLASPSTSDGALAIGHGYAAAPDGTLRLLSPHSEQGRVVLGQGVIDPRSASPMTGYGGAPDLVVDGNTVHLPRLDENQTLYASPGITEIKLPYEAKIDLQIINLNEVPAGVAIAQPGVKFEAPGERSAPVSEELSEQLPSNTRHPLKFHDLLSSCCKPPEEVLTPEAGYAHPAGVRGSAGAMAAPGAVPQTMTILPPEAKQNLYKGFEYDAGAHGGMPSAVYAGPLDPIIMHDQPGMGNIDFHSINNQPQILTQMGVRQLGWHAKKYQGTGEMLYPPLPQHPAVPMTHQGLPDVNALRVINTAILGTAGESIVQPRSVDSSQALHTPPPSANPA
eukprot:Lankesteria_metandrocarpae@DN10396_c0_g1_i1.p1